MSALGAIVGFVFSLGFWAFASYTAYSARDRRTDRRDPLIQWGFVIIYGVICWLGFEAFGYPSFD